jgi:predicted  nucleic acid-binding Zn-ribbon protein
LSAAELEALLALQDLDTHIDQERNRKVRLPERGELAQLERLIGQKETARSEVAALGADVASRQEAAERELQATEDRVAQVNTRLYGGTVTASRELQAMAADVESLKKRASELEDRALLLMEEREPFDKELAQLDGQLAELGARQLEVRASLANAESEVDADISTLSAQRPQAAGAVPEQLLGAYERQRARLGGVAVARLVGGRCDGCHLTLPAVELDRIRHESAGTLEYCEQCGRILVIAGSL